MGNKIQIDLIGKPGCHLCEDAEVALGRVLGAFQVAHPHADLVVLRRSILDEPELAARHGEEIPVVLLNGQMHSYWRIDEERLIKKLEELS